MSKRTRIKNEKPTVSPEREATQALLNSAGAEFAGRPLSKFTPRKQAVATEMGMKWPTIPQEDILVVKFRAKNEKTGKMEGRSATHYKGSFQDSVIYAWICQQPDHRVERAGRKPDEAMDEAWRWAEKIGLNQGTELAGIALGLWLAAAFSISQAEGEPVAKHKTDEGEPPEGEL